MTVAAPARPRGSRAGRPMSSVAGSAVAAIEAGQWQITKTDQAAHRLDVPADMGDGWEQWFLLTSDWHLDNPHCDRARLKRTLDLARERNAIHMAFGDMFDLMQGKYDPRSNKADLRPDYIGKPYLQAALDDATGFMSPYAGDLAICGLGNHCTAVTRRVEWDIAENFTTRLRNEHGSRVVTGAYAGYVRLVFTSKAGAVRGIVVAYDHGSGGGGPVTRGVIGTNRRATYTPDADWILTGHVHERWHVETTQERLSRTGVVSLKPQHHLCLGGWKEERLAGREFHVERGRGPKPLGGYWARVYTINAKRHEIAVDFTMTN